MRQKPPGAPYFVVATPSDVGTIQLFGGQAFEGVTFTKDQLRSLGRYYEFDPDVPVQQAEDAASAMEAKYQTKLAEWGALTERVRRWAEKPRRPIPNVEGVTRMHQAGSDRNLFRNIQVDGLRVMALLSTFLEPGEDPVELVQHLCANAGYDCTLDDWGGSEEEPLE